MIEIIFNMFMIAMIAIPLITAFNLFFTKEEHTEEIYHITTSKDEDWYI